MVELKRQRISKEKRRDYYAALTGPIKGHIKKAARQLKETAEREGGSVCRALVLVDKWIRRVLV